MAGEGGRRGIPWGRRESSPPAPADTDEPLETPAAPAEDGGASGPVEAPAAPAGDGGASGPQPAPTFERVEAVDAAETGMEHSHPSYRTIDHFPAREPAGEPGFWSAQDLDAVADARFEEPAAGEARVVSEPPPEEPEEFRYHSGKIRPANEPDAIEFVEVHKAFGRNQVLRGLNMSLPENRISMILGPSGTGKSVCIKHIVGLLYPDQGDVIVHGHSIPSLPDADLFELRKKFGVLFQDGALFGSMNLYDNVAFPLRQHTEKGDEEIAEIVNRRLKEVGLGNANEKMPNELSGGMRKRAGFARALVMEPDIVLFDEPDSGLDPVRTALLCELIKEVHAENGGCYVVITHDIMSARRVAEHISVLWKGRIVESGPAEELFASENPFVQQFLSGASAGPLGME